MPQHDPMTFALWALVVVFGIIILSVLVLVILFAFYVLYVLAMTGIELVAPQWVDSVKVGDRPNRDVLLRSVSGDGAKELLRAAGAGDADDSLLLRAADQSDDCALIAPRHPSPLGRHSLAFLFRVDAMLDRIRQELTAEGATEEEMLADIPARRETSGPTNNPPVLG